jgi:hypothetical protein
MLEVGEAKTFKVGREISELDPYIDQVHLTSGLNQASLAELAAADPDIIFDEADDFLAKVQIREFAQAHQVPVVMATDVGHKSVVDVERYDLQMPQLFNGRLDRSDIELIKSGPLSPGDKMRITTKLIGITNASVRLLDSTMDPQLAGLPQLGSTASLGGVEAAKLTPDIILGSTFKSGRSVVSLRNDLGLKNQSSVAEGVDVLKRMRGRRKSR